jgi:hypothetical protein
LRWAIRRGLEETFRAAQVNFEERLTDAVGATKGVIEEALARRRDQSFARDESLEQLDKSVAALVEAEEAVAR